MIRSLHRYRASLILLAFLAIAVGGVVVVGSMPAFAQDIGSDSPTVAPSAVSSIKTASAAAPRAVEWFDRILGRNGNVSALPKMLTALFSVISMIAGVMASYTVIMAVMAGAHDGEVLGRRHSSLWVPLRFLVAMALLIPVSGGLSLGGLLVYKMVPWANGLGNLVWIPMVDQLVKDGIPIAAPAPTGSEKVIKGLLDAYVCAAALNTTVEEMNAQVTTARLKLPSPLINVGTRVEFKADSPDFWDRNFGKPETDSRKFKVLFTDKNGTPVCGGIQYAGPGKTDIGLQAKLASAQETALNQVSQSVLDLAQAFVTAQRTVATTGEGTATVGQERVTAVVTAYRTALAKTLSDIVKSARTDKTAVNGFASALKAKGWTEAGAWFVRMANVNAEAADAITGLPEPIAPALGSIGNAALRKQAQSITRSFGAYWEAAARNAGYPGYENQVRVGVGSDDAPTSEGTFGLFASGITEVLNRFGAMRLFDISANGGGDPFGSIVASGRLLVNLSLFVVVALIGAGFAATAGTFTIASPIVSATLSFLFGAVVSPLVITGAYLGYVLPFQPYMLFTTAILGWLFLGISAIISTMLVALLMIKMEGDGIFAEVKQALLLYLNFVLRPALLLIGLYMGMGLFYIMAGFMGETAGPALAAATGLPGGTFMGILINTVLFAAFYYLIAKKCFSLIHRIPDLILRFIGAQDMADDDLYESAKGYAMGAVGWVRAMRSPFQVKPKDTSASKGGNKIGP